MAHMSHDVVPSLGSLSCKMFSKWISTVPPQNVEKLRSYYQSYPLGIIQDVVRYLIIQCGHVTHAVFI